MQLLETRLVEVCPLFGDLGFSFDGNALTLSLDSKQDLPPVWRSFDDLCIAAHVVLSAKSLRIEVEGVPTAEVDMEDWQLDYLGEDDISDKVDRLGGVLGAQELAERVEALIKFIPEACAVVSHDGTTLATNTEGGELFPSCSSECVCCSGSCNILDDFGLVNRERIQSLLTGTGGATTVLLDERRFSVRSQQCGRSYLLSATEVGAIPLPIRLNHLDF